jgi:hypothetical protein
MADHLDFQVDPGIELRAALRGPRLSLGPRIDRVEPAVSEVADASGASGASGEMAASDASDEAASARRWSWAELAGGGLVPTPEPKGRRARRRKRQEWQTVHDHLVAVTTMHDRLVDHTREPVLEPTHADRDEVRARWAALVRNEPTVVRERLATAFEAHRFSAAVASVHGDRADLVVPVAKPSALVGDREPTTETSGARTLPRMTKERRHQVYEAAIGSGLMSTAAEAFAVAPGLGRVAAAVVAPEQVGGPAVLLLVEVSRKLVLPDAADRAAIGSIGQVEEAEPSGLGRVVIDRGRVSGALRPLEPSHPDVSPILAVLTTQATA